MEAIIKLQKARKLIKEKPLKKAGFNDFSKYDYYTPEQVDKMVFEVSQELNLFNKFDLKRTEQGLMASVTITDIDSGKSITFETATEIPEIKATNAAQQLGGTMTFSNRYLLMMAYDIVDNNLDFDTPKKEAKNDFKKQDDGRPWLSENQFTQAIDRIKMNKFEEGMNPDEFLKRLKTEFKMKKDYSEQLQAQLELTKKLG